MTLKKAILKVLGDAEVPMNLPGIFAKIIAEKYAITGAYTYTSSDLHDAILRLVAEGSVVCNDLVEAGTTYYRFELSPLQKLAAI